MIILPLVLRDKERDKLTKPKDSGGKGGFSGGPEDKESAYNAEDRVPESGRSPGEENGYSLQDSCLENSGQRNLAGYSRWDDKELDTAERLTLPFFFKDSVGLS